MTIYKSINTFINYVQERIRHGQSSVNYRNLIVFTLVSSIWATIMGLIGPFYVIQISKLSGGMHKMGVAFSIIVLVQSATTYIAGHYSDRLGKKIFLFMTAYIDAFVFFSYTVISETSTLYLMQALLGVSGGISQTIETSLLSDLTEKSCRGKGIGKFNALVSLASGFGLLISGYVAELYGIKYLFYMASSVILASTLFLFLIKENVDEDCSEIEAESVAD